MIYHRVEQNTEAWHLLRMGRPTASAFDRIVTPGGKKKDPQPSKQAESYMHFLLAEYMTGHPIIQESSKWQQRGHELEGEAIKAAEFALDVETQPGGFVTTNDGRIGCSPDRLIGDDELLEIKCPKDSNHVGYMLNGDIDDEYRVQLQGQLWVMERKAVKIVSYHDELPTVVLHVERDEEFISKMAPAIIAFADVLDKAKAMMADRFGPFQRKRINRRDPALDNPDLYITDDDVEELLSAYDKGLLVKAAPKEMYRPKPRMAADSSDFDSHMREAQ